MRGRGAVEAATPVGDRVKTDARDAVHLARPLRLGEIVEVTVPSIEAESARDLVRAREDARGDLMSARHRVSKLLLRQGIQYSAGKAWTVAHHACVVSDNGSAYKSHAWHDACTELGITAMKTRPYRPQTNGKSIERFHRTLADGWAYARFYGSESDRRTALPGWLHFYNYHRHHSAIGAPPISRINNSCPWTSHLAHVSQGQTPGTARAGAKHAPCTDVERRASRS